MLDLNINQSIGDMMVSLRDNELYINSIFIKKEKRGQGYGTKFLEFAKKISKRYGKQGRLKCIVSTLGTDTTSSSHIFFRKNGFDAYNKQELQKIDEAIKNNVTLDYKDCQIMYMYYPSEK